MTRPEILAPAGSPEALTAAVLCGADAVYLGCDGFNARQNAHHFSLTESLDEGTVSLREAVSFCHAHQVAVHVTLNTLVREDEMDAALRVAAAACACGADALIVQDRGLARRIHAMAPEMKLHASTQLSCHTPAGVRALRDAGFCRVVLAREMTREEIAACGNLGCEREVFVHGALCMSVSGQCYLSAMIGGRSGNRGWCAQPCRLPFATKEGCPATDKTALSLKDQSLWRYLPEMAADGITSFKIEGRMKRPEYVAAAVTVCRAAADGKEPDETVWEDLQAVFSRSGFTDGYFTGHRGSAMFGTRRKEDVIAATPAVFKRLAHLYEKEAPRVPVQLSLLVHAGQPVTLTATDGTFRTVAQGAVPETAEHAPLTAEKACGQLAKTGGTPFAATVEATIEDGLRLPASQLNALRRTVLEELYARRAAPVPVAFDALAQPCPVSRPASPLRRTDRPLIVARAAHRGQAVGKADCWIVPLDGECPGDGRWGVEIPRGLFGQEDAVRAALHAAAERGASVALCGNVGAISLAREAGLLPLGNYSLNVTNAAALDALTEDGLVAAMLSFELTFAQMGFAAASPIPTGLFVYGRQPLMLTRNCPRSSAIGCGGCHGNGSLTDRLGKRFPLMCSGGCTELLNSVPLFWADKRSAFPAVDFWYLHFTDETPEQVNTVLCQYRDGTTAVPAEITRGLYKRGVM